MIKQLSGAIREYKKASILAPSTAAWSFSSNPFWRLCLWFWKS